MGTKMTTAIKAGAIVSILVFASGCTSGLKAQVEALEAKVDAMAADVDAATANANSAAQTASGAQSTANQALNAANQSQACCDATNEKIDRMFESSQSK